MHRLRRSVARGAVGPLVAAAMVLLPATAAADVTVAASRAEPGARDVTITFRVTNDDPAVPTTRLEVFLPTVRPLHGVEPIAPRGWTARVTTAGPAPALALAPDGGPVDPVVTAVAWEGGTVPGADYAVFPIDVDRLPAGAGPLRFRVVQTYLDGTAVEWSDLMPSGAPRPAHPALTVSYGPAPDPAAAQSAVQAHQHGATTAEGAAPAGGGPAGWFVALVGAVGALVAAGTTALGRRQRRRFATLRDDP